MRRSVLTLLMAMTFCAMSTATIVIPMSIEEMTVKADRVVRARAMSSHSEWNPAHTEIDTFTTFQVIETMKGAQASTIVVRQMGGHVGNVIQKVSGVRHWNLGEEQVLFLRPSEVGGGVTAVVGLFQGSFRVQRAGAAAMVSNGAPEALQYDPTRQTTGQFRSSNITLDELRQRVSRVVAR